MMSSSSHKGKDEKREAEKSEKMHQLGEWLTECVRFNNVPRMSEATVYVREKLGGGLSQRDIREAMSVHPYFKMNLRQQRAEGRS